MRISGELRGERVLREEYRIKRRTKGKWQNYIHLLV